MGSTPTVEKTDSRVAEATAAGSDLGTLLDYVGQRPSLQERFAAGKALRNRVARADHANYKPADNRLDPIGLLEAQNRARVAKLVPVRFARMLASPFAFLRGSAAVMAADIAPGPTSGIQVQACGDMHVANFGLFGSAERNLVFAIKGTFSKARDANGFLYLVSYKGVTGQKNFTLKPLKPLIKAIRKATRVPLVVGFGIRDKLHASEAIRRVMVGSSCVSERRRACGCRSGPLPAAPRCRPRRGSQPRSAPR